MKRVISVLVAVAATAAIAGCSTHPFVPAAATAYHQPAKATKLSAPLLGIDVYSETAYSVTQSASYGTPILAYLKNKLSAQVVGLMWDLCSPGFKSNAVAQCKTGLEPTSNTVTGSMSPAAIKELSVLAEADGLKVAMRPIIRVGVPSGWNNPDKSWEGHLKPSSEAKFFTNLLKAELPYLKVAKQVHAEQFVVTTELMSFSYSPSWLTFLSKAQKDCGCQVSYAAHDTEYLANSPTLPPIKALGVDYYPTLRIPPSASQAEVTGAWEQSLAGVAESRLERTTMDEISIRGTDGAYRNPANWNLTGKANPAIQYRYFIAACQTAAHFHMRGLFFYFVPLNDDISNPTQFAAYFVRNAGSAAIRGCKAILATGAVK